MTVLLVVLVLAIFGIAVYIQRKKKAEAKPSYNGPVKKHYVPSTPPKQNTGPGWSPDDGSPIKLPNETLDEYNAREAQWYYTTMRQ